MGEPSDIRVIVDRISHEVEYFRAYLKHAVLKAPTSSTTRSGGPPTTSTSIIRWHKLGVAMPKTVLLPQKGYPRTWTSTPESFTTGVSD